MPGLIVRESLEALADLSTSAPAEWAHASKLVGWTGGSKLEARRRGAKLAAQHGAAAVACAALPEGAQHFVDISR